MFTGLVVGLGPVVGMRPSGAELEVSVEVGELAPRVEIGGSMALSGVCCTATVVEGDIVSFLLSAETLRRTWFGDLKVGRELNLELPLRLSDMLGGHLVQGHVDGVGEVVEAIDPKQGGELWVRLPAELLKYCVEKGSITLDGVSLTIAGIDGERIWVAVIPHTAVVTTLGRAKVGDGVNVEVDVLAKYVERLLAVRE